MNLLNIEDRQSDRPFSIFVLGFRPFFIAAGIFAIISMLLWLGLLNQHLGLPRNGFNPFQWHAHEMVYGFAMAVVSGFLLTAIKNWTGLQTIQYKPLIALVSLWLLGRICLFLGENYLIIAAIADLLYNLFLFLACLQPVLRVKQWTQVGLISKLLLLTLGNLLFYLGAFGVLEQGINWSIEAGVLLIIAIIMTMGRRVVPFFIERGVGYPVQLKNPLWVDRGSLVFFLGFTLVEVFTDWTLLSSLLAASLVLVSAVRLYLWHTPGLWKLPLLWGLYLAFAFITLGFLIFALLPLYPAVNASIALHSMTYGGIALITMSMMARVSLGHTGRQVHEPLPGTGMAQSLLVLGALIRIVPTTWLNESYMLWINLSLLCWIVAFILFLWLYLPILISPRIDGTSG